MKDYMGFRGFSVNDDGNIFELSLLGMFEFDQNDGHYCYIDTIPKYIYIKDGHDLIAARKFLSSTFVKDDENDSTSIFFNAINVTRPGIYALEYDNYDDSACGPCMDLYYREINSRIDGLEKQLNSYKTAKKFIITEIGKGKKQWPKI